MKTISFRKFSLTLVISVLSACGASSSMGNRAQDDWLTHTVEIGSKRISFSVQTDQSKAGPGPMTPANRVTLDSIELARTDKPMPLVYMGYWDYGGGFGKQPDGTLSFEVMVGRSPIGYEKDIQELSALAEAIWLSDVAYYRRQHADQIMRGKAQLPQPEPYKPVKINGADWLAYTSDRDQMYMATALDDTHYLFVVIDLSLTPRSPLYPKALEIAKRISQSFKVDSLR